MAGLSDIKQEIWLKCRKSVTNVQVAADKLNISLPLTNEKDAERLLQSLSKKRAKPKREIPSWVIARYNQAHHEWFLQNLPLTHKDGHYLAPVFPDVGTSNGLTRMIVDYLKWAGYRATRISVEGRVLPDGTRIKSSTRKGTADVSSTIKGRSVQWEVKVGKDKPSPEQLREQALERKAGGEYLFIHTAEEFFYELDKLLSS